MKERIKSVILVVLVIMNLILGSSVLSTKKLWSGNGYNFFHSLFTFPVSCINSIKQHFAGAPAETLSTTKFELPKLIVVNTGYQTSRCLLMSNDSDFIPTFEIVKPFLNDAFSRPQDFVVVSREQLQGALTAKSIYLKYPTEYDSSLFSYLIGAGSGDFSQSFSQLSYIVVASDGYVYAEDSVTGKVYRNKTSVTSDNFNNLIDNYTNVNNSQYPVINYAFDLGFDKSFATQKIVLSPMILIYSESFNCETVNVTKPLISDDGKINETIISAILSNFSMNPDGQRRYTEVDGTVVFVENNSILKVSPDGTIDFQAKDNGIQLSKNATPTVNETVAAIAGFVDKINLASGSEATVQLSSELTSNVLERNSFTVTLDYYANGSLVKIPDSHAVTITVTNGRITSYNHMIRDFKVNNQKVLVNDYITALDNAIALYQNQFENIEINELQIAYIYNNNQQTIIPQWNVSAKEIVIQGE